MRDNLVLTRKESGKRIEGIKGSVQNKIYLTDVKIPIEKGDIFEQELPSGLKKRMIVTEVHVPMGHHYEIEYVSD